MDLFDNFDPVWIWLAAGLALAALEMVVPGVYLIWLAAAAIITGALAFVLDLGVLFQVINFVFLALIMVYSAKRWLRDRPIESSDPLLNNRGGRMVGETAVVVAPIDGGEGRVKFGDSEWIARGPDCGAGTRVRITAAKGPILAVEPITAGANSDASSGTLTET
ncbi:NfeD family protein [Altererythrobacter luteolus]|uniref:NfeD family protein n=1 Tax=Pontixanthobacter luteolus TaxID=295089 RepID=A0A6I4V497_9SPHN|nr:NfeD family protein [Pontixanthobacter luteolus]MXP48201.1 NfeD family protein [Pontixanthobacter luteolus]